MKLYSTTTSERASKGQGGNEYLLIEILDKNRDKLITLHITAARSNLRGEHYNIYLTNHQSEYIDMLNEEKGEKQKGEKCNCGEYPCKYTKKIYCKVCSRWYTSDELDPCDIPF